MRRATIAMLCCLFAAPAGAAPLLLSLLPRSAQVAFRAYGLGFLPIDGSFTRFTGTLRLDPDDPAACSIDVRAEAASLQMPDASMTRDALGEDLLDVGRHPAFAFEGQCSGGRLHGTLLLHGVTRPLTMDVVVVNAVWTATGIMLRAEWGMGARPMMAGPEVRLRVTAALPPGFPNRP